MPLVEHAEVQNDTAKHAAFACSKQESTCDQTTIALDKAHAGADDPPSQSEERKIFATAHNFEQPVGRDVDEDIKDVEDGKRDVVFVAIEVQVIDEAVDFGIADLEHISTGLFRRYKFECSRCCDQ